MTTSEEQLESESNAAGEEVDAGSVGVVDFVRESENSQPVSSVPVRISYGIIERFSEGLYSSPNKTFEELITNSYDAGANQVWVYLSSDLSEATSKLVVLDDGESMDLAGLEDLWKIGESRKRSAAPPPGRKSPVGKFGIGKLATYVLAEELTYITHRDDQYLAVTMDYGRIARKPELLDSVAMTLDVVSLTETGALDALRKSLDTIAKDPDEVIADLAARPHWTAAILSNLKPTAHRIQLGRLRWVLRSALPLNPDFQLYLNGEHLESSKADGTETWSFVVGKDGPTESSNPDSPWGPGQQTSVEVISDNGEVSQVPALKLPRAGTIWGRATMFEKPLDGGRSSELGRSHGFFVRVRGRLINLYDADFSVGPELRHGTLTRFRMEINADDLDDHVASARETLRESVQLQELKNYLLAVFNRARSESAKVDASDTISNVGRDGRLAKPSDALSQGPFRRLLQRVVSGEAPIAERLGLDDDGVEATKQILVEGGDVVERVAIEPRGNHSPFAVYDAPKRAVVLNQSHPFVSNYLGGKSSAEPLQLLGLSELLTQAYLLDENISPEVISRVMSRRDSFLRELTFRFPRSASIIAERLRDAITDEDALEEAIGDALELLGFEVKRLGGSSHGADGIGTARLGQRGSTSESYAFTYEAKSTKKGVTEALGKEAGSETTVQVARPGRIRADTARTSVLRVHRERAAEKHDLDIKPNFTLLVAPDFQGALDSDGLINEVCINDGITAIRVEDLAATVELFALKGLNPVNLKKMFDLRTPEETRAWVQAQADKVRVARPPVSVLVEVLVENSERKAPVVMAALPHLLASKDRDLDLGENEVEALVRGLAALAPMSVYTDGKYVALNASSAALYDEIRESLHIFDPELVGEYLGTVPESKAK